MAQGEACATSECHYYTLCDTLCAEDCREKFESPKMLRWLLALHRDASLLAKRPKVAA
jgi:hypothetical protein